MMGNTHDERARLWNGYMGWKLSDENKAKIKTPDNKLLTFPELTDDEKEEIRELYETQGLDQRTFDPNIEQSADNLEGGVDFSNTILKNEINFSEFIFPPGSKFNDTEFREKISFVNAKFGNKINFDTSKFNKELDFSNVCFGDKISFDGTEFLGRADFQNAIFSGSISFEKAIFPGTLVFLRTTFSEYTKFTSSKFSTDPNFSEAEFIGKVKFEGAKFEKRASFGSVKFKGGAEFNKTNFKSEANFANAKFFGEIDFSNTQFYKNTIFKGATVENLINFDNSTFSKKVSFENTVFKNNSEFRHSHFNGMADFSVTDASCSKISKNKNESTFDFSNAKFSSETNFRGRHFINPPRFFEAELHEHTYFDEKIKRWPAAPRNKQKAETHIKAYQRLALLMNRQEKREDRHFFNRLEMRARRVKEGRLGLYSLGNRFYQLFAGYGYSLFSVTLFWVGHILLGAGLLSFPYLPYFGGDGLSWEVAVAAFFKSFINAHPFLLTLHVEKRAEAVLFEAFSRSYESDTLLSYNYQLLEFFSDHLWPDLPLLFIPDPTQPISLLTARTRLPSA